MDLDMRKLEALLGTVVNELGAASNAALVILGDKLGLFRALAEGAVTPAELAKKTGTYERYVREWLSAQAASGFVTYDALPDKFSMSPEQAAVFAQEDSPVAMVGGFSLLSAVYHDEPQLAEAFKSGKGLHWGEHCNCLFCGVERFFRPGYRAISLADGCRRLTAWSRSSSAARKSRTSAAATACPPADGRGVSEFGIRRHRLHEASIGMPGSEANGRRTCASRSREAQDFAGRGYDLVTMFDALHDMGDPVGAVRTSARQCADGTLMLVEPAAGDNLAENLNPVGRVYYAGSTHICVPTSLNQEVGLALGAQAGAKRIGDVVREGGFSRSSARRRRRRST